MRAALPKGWLRSVGATTQAAKLHVLGLVPLKAKLGPKWDRLADLVHKLFEKAIERHDSPHPDA